MEKQRVRDAGDAGQRQYLRRRRFVAGYSVSHRTVQTDVITEGEARPEFSLEFSPEFMTHDDEPALGSDLDRDPVIGAVPFDGIDENSLAVKHRSLVRFGAATKCRIEVRSGK